MAAGLEEAQALSLASDISEWAKSLNISQITTAQIRDQVIARMQKINPYSGLTLAKNIRSWYFPQILNTKFIHINHRLSTAHIPKQALISPFG